MASDWKSLIDSSLGASELAVEAMMVTSACVGWEAAGASASASGLVIEGTKVTGDCVGWVVAVVGARVLSLSLMSFASAIDFEL